MRNVIKVQRQGLVGQLRRTFGRHRPIFVFGHQKSGTTAIAALTAHASQRTVKLDFKKEIKNPTYDKIGASYSLEDFIQAHQASFRREIIKAPNLTPFSSSLISKFPPRKHLFIVRNPEDTIRSICDRLNLPGVNRNLTPEFLGEIPIGWRLILDNSWLGLEAEDYLGSLAMRWNLMAERYRDDSASYVLIKYEDFLADKEGAIDRVLLDLGISKKVGIESVKDHQYQPKGSGIAASDFFDAASLKRIRTLCAKNMAHFEYGG